MINVEQIQMRFCIIFITNKMLSICSLYAVGLSAQFLEKSKVILLLNEMEGNIDIQSR